MTFVFILILLAAGCSRSDAQTATVTAVPTASAALQPTATLPAPSTPVPPTPVPTSIPQVTPSGFALAAIGGRVWRDASANGVADVGEPGIGGVQVSLGIGTCPSTGAAIFTTDANGEYHFTNLNAGTYCVSIDPRASTNLPILLSGNWTYPVPPFGSASITLKAGESRTDVHFGWAYQFAGAPTPPGGGSCNYRATFLGDVRLPDNTSLFAGSPFVKTWRVRNDGTCSWGPNGYALDALIFTGGDNLGAPQIVPLPQVVNPGDVVDLTINMIAPTVPGPYRSEWKLRNLNGGTIGFGRDGTLPLYAQLIVVALPPADHGDGPCINRATFLGDVTIPDGTSILAGTSFVKVWRLRNDGNCTWGPDYYNINSLAFVGGDPLGAASIVPLPREVRPGDTVDVAVDMIAPALAGSYISQWKLRDAAGGLLGVGANGTVPLSAQINVQSILGTGPVRIQFAPGTFSTAVPGIVQFPNRDQYVLRAFGGQRMTVELISDNNRANFSIQGVGDGQPLKRLENEDRRWSAVLPSTQDYLITIATPQGQTNYTLAITIAP